MPPESTTLAFLPINIANRISNQPYFVEDKCSTVNIFVLHHHHIKRRTTAPLHPLFCAFPMCAFFLLWPYLASTKCFAKNSSAALRPPNKSVCHHHRPFSPFLPLFHPAFHGVCHPSPIITFDPGLFCLDCNPYSFHPFNSPSHPYALPCLCVVYLHFFHHSCCSPFRRCWELLPKILAMYLFAYRSCNCAAHLECECLAFFARKRRIFFANERKKWGERGIWFIWLIWTNRTKIEGWQRKKNMDPLMAIDGQIRQFQQINGSKMNGRENLPFVVQRQPPDYPPPPSLFSSFPQKSFICPCAHY